MNLATYQAIKQAIQEETPAASATVLTGSHAGQVMLISHPDVVTGSLGNEALTQSVLSSLKTRLNEGGALEEEILGERVFFEAYLPPPHLVIIGAVHIAIPLIEFAHILGFRTSVIDARGVFATEERFPEVGQLIEAWPDEGLATIHLHPGVSAVVLAHDEKFEDPALEVLLRSDVGYIGAVGSKDTSANRLVRLKSYGFSESDLQRIHGPIGLDLGGRSPAEIALAIMSEIIAVRNGKDPRAALAAAKSG